MIARVRELDIANERVHGGGRRPEPEFVVDPAALAEWTARNRRAVQLNRLRPKREAAADLIVRRDDAGWDQ